MADTREMLIALIAEKQDCGLTHNAKGHDFVTYNAELADHLIANGVTTADKREVVGDNLSPKTTADRIRAMSDEEMAGIIAENPAACFCCANVCEANGPEDLPERSVCREGVLRWLKQPAEGVAE